MNSSVSFHVAEVVVAGGLEFVPDESQAEHETPEGVEFVFRLLRPGACAADLPGKLAEYQAKLDLSPDLPGIHQFRTPRMAALLFRFYRHGSLFQPFYLSFTCSQKVLIILMHHMRILC